MKDGISEWQEQIIVHTETGRRILMCACSDLSSETQDEVGFVIVFDDITIQLQSQRDAAWGEVARRLAHEIKNPLTPIQLSAERLRRKYLKKILHTPLASTLLITVYHVTLCLRKVA